MITNGFIIEKKLKENGKDEHGNSIPATETFGRKMPAFIRNKTYNYLSKSDEGNSYIKYSFEVMIEQQKHDFKQGGRIKLVREDETIGEFSIISIEPYTAVSMIQILV